MIVEKGIGNGKLFGYPTINIYEDITLEDGVYKVKVNIKNKELYGILTYMKNSKRIEIHLLDFDEEVYGEEVKILEIKKIRKLQSYKTLDEKNKTTKKDIEEMRNGF